MAFSKGMLHNAHDREWKVSRRGSFPASERGQVLLSQTSGAARCVLTVRGQVSAMPDNF